MSIPDLETVFSRRHPRHLANRGVWERSRAAYAGGEPYIRRALIRHVSEIELEFEERVARAYYFNYPRKLARLITQYATSVEPRRENVDCALAEDWSRSGLRVDEVMRQFSTMLNLYGGAALAVEMPFFEGDVDCERRAAERLRPAVRALSPLEVADYAFARDGKLAWILFEEEELCGDDPFQLPVRRRRRKLWTRDEYYILERGASGGSVSLVAHGRHGLGEVPAVLVFEPDGMELTGRHYFEDVVRISDAILNQESEAQMNIVKQMFGLLVISDSFARGAAPAPECAGDGGMRFSHILARSAAIWESPEERGISRYIAPSGVETSAIREANRQLKKELFDVVGMALQPELAQAQTAESKAWDQHQIRQFLSCRADVLEQAECAAWKLMRRFDPAIPLPQVIYNREFAMIDLSSSVAALLQLRELATGDEFRREVERTGLYFLEKFKKVDPQRRRRILAEIEREAVHA